MTRTQHQQGLLALPNDLLDKIAGAALRCGAGTALSAACRDLRDATSAALQASPGLRLQLAARQLRALYGAYGSDCVTADGIYSCGGARKLLLPEHLTEVQRAEALLALAQELVCGVEADDLQEEQEVQQELRDQQRDADVGRRGWRPVEGALVLPSGFTAVGGAGGGLAGEEEGVRARASGELQLDAVDVEDGGLVVQRAWVVLREDWRCWPRMWEQVQALITVAARVGDTRSMTGLMRAVGC
ncbi:hypothetical protein HYH02_003655 [Chlamydomonas schloesseri]|uniref:Uncharacterized protein n=1 Tax=Chlamydomonas schloesseri TaxID=2026947 RepID=A0A836BA39_9CHLO|nr:hypothetical protein HYH02_003655 [Chlamydomonas schloesseri]|eukprot:KAG2451880.1 hypothetical protein HYH02_003655 [Chlamydomonas schloesseri]